MISNSTRLLVGITVLFMCSTPLFASVTYAYLGNPYTDCNAQGNQLPIPCSEFGYTSTTVFFTVPALMKNLSYMSITPISYLLFDGHECISNVDPNCSNGAYLQFNLATNSSGIPIFWEIIATGNYWWGTSTIETHNAPGSGPVFDAVTDEGYTGAVYFGRNQFTPGHWFAPVPEPATTTMGLTGLAMVGYMRRRWFHRK